MYSDGLTEAESPDGQPFDEAGLERTLALYAGAYQKIRCRRAGQGGVRRGRAPPPRSAPARRSHGPRPQPSGRELCPERSGSTRGYRPASRRVELSSLRSLITGSQVVRPSGNPGNPICNACKPDLLCLALSLARICAAKHPSRPLDEEDSPSRHSSRRSRPRSRPWIARGGSTCSRRPPIAIRRSSSSMPWCRRASRASSSRSAIDRRCRGRCPAKASVWSSKSSWRPARAAASPRGVSTSAVRAVTTSAASRGASSREDRLASIEGLHRLALHPEKQFAAKNLVLKAIDFELRLPAGDVFVAETPEGRDRDGADRRGHDGVSARAQGREGPAEVVLRRRGARDAVHDRLRPHQPV